MERNCSQIMSTWARAHGAPLADGKLKLNPEDFIVIEQMNVGPSGEGEHCWLRIRKTKLNTEQVAKQLARFSRVAYRDVGYSGRKDFFAVTEQWFSVWLPGAEDPDWQAFEMPGVEILNHQRHSRKVKLGTHSANHFSIVVRDFVLRPSITQQHITDRLNLIKTAGVPNYFGPQRFGREASNIDQAMQMFAGTKKIKDRRLRSLMLSAARSWLFNNIASARVADGTWTQLLSGEPANLDGSASVFTAVGEPSEEMRLAALDIHPTAPMWGEYKVEYISTFADLHDFEMALLQPDRQLAEGLIAARVAYQRRTLRMRVTNLDWQLEGDTLKISFSLQKGQFATSVMRELLSKV